MKEKKRKKKVIEDKFYRKNTLSRQLLFLIALEEASLKGGHFNNCTITLINYVKNKRRLWRLHVTNVIFWKLNEIITSVFHNISTATIILYYFNDNNHGYTGNDTFSIIFAFEKVQSRLGKKESYEKSFYRFQSTEFPLEEEPRKFVPDNTRDKYTGALRVILLRSEGSVATNATRNNQALDLRGGEEAGFGPLPPRRWRIIFVMAIKALEDTRAQRVRARP